MNAAFTPYVPMLMEPAGQVVRQQTIHRAKPVTSGLEDP
jgi:hypothetical protein